MNDTTNKPTKRSPWMLTDAEAAEATAMSAVASNVIPLAATRKANQSSTQTKIPAPKDEPEGWAEKEARVLAATYSILSPSALGHMGCGSAAHQSSLLISLIGDGRVLVSTTAGAEANGRDGANMLLVEDAFESVPSGIPGLEISVWHARDPGDGPPHLIMRCLVAADASDTFFRSVFGDWSSLSMDDVSKMLVGGPTP